MLQKEICKACMNTTTLGFNEACWDVGYCICLNRKVKEYSKVEVTSKKPPAWCEYLLEHVVEKGAKNGTVA
jgi:hypothetical protein